MKTNRIHLLLITAFLASAQLAAAQTYPDKPVRIIVPFATGTAGDTISRLLADSMSGSLKQPFIVENRPGAGGNVGSQAAARSPADGYTILMAATPNFAINQTLYSKAAVGFDADTDFRPLGLAMSAPNLIVANNAVPFKDFAGMLAYARKNPGHLSFGSYAAGSTGHLAGAMINAQAGIDLLHIAAKDPLTMVAGEHIQLALVTPTATLPLVRAGRLKALAVTSTRRLSSAQDIPTVSESGLTGFEATAWYGYVVPKRTPDAIARVLETELERAINSPRAKEFARTSGNEITWMNAATFGAYVKQERAKWGDAVRRSGAQPD